MKIAFEHGIIFSCLTIATSSIKLRLRWSSIKIVKTYPKEVRSHVSLFKQNHLCYVSASVNDLLFPISN
jgi:hypothetical protein